MIESHETWRDNVLGTEMGRTAQALTSTARSVFQVLFDLGPEGMDFTGFVPSKVSPIHLCTALRATSRWRNTIPGWHEAAQVAYNACLLHGLDPKAATSGLLV